jgi:flagellar hook-associated protein 2
LINEALKGHKELRLPGITFGGINTGLPPNLVDQLIEVERMPIKSIQTQKGKSETRLKLVQELDTKVADIKGKIGELANSHGFTDMKLISGDPNIITGTADPAIATTGSWSVEVERLAEKAAAMTNGFPDKDKTQVGIGYFKFKTADGEKDIYVNGKNNTLTGAANAINNAHVGVKATVINDRKSPDAPFKLMITADGVGQDKNVSYPTLYFLDGDQDFYFDKDRKGVNGLVKVDGFEFEIPDNTLKDVIPGVTLELKRADQGHPINLSIKEDMEVVSGKVKGFVDSVNAVLGFIQTQNKLDKGTDTTQTLGGDGLLRSIEMRFRQLFQSPQYGIAGDVKLIGQLGVNFNRNGLLEFDQKKFDGVLAAKADQVHAFLAGDGFSTGFIPALKREITNLTNGAYGPLANRRKGLQDKIEQFDRRIEQKEKQLGRKEEQLRDKFSKLEETMSRLKSQGSAVSALGGGGFSLPGLSQG